MLDADGPALGRPVRAADIARGRGGAGAGVRVEGSAVETDFGTSAATGRRAASGVLCSH
ncbi:MAG: hypothetical protein M3256_06055 [Actinomycetota bacterium]|nr:hypothetical protein [Actinomycetota bacterium]